MHPLNCLANIFKSLQNNFYKRHWAEYFQLVIIGTVEVTYIVRLMNSSNYLYENR
jgi:hypothetical protein